ncbi:MAG TPA: response regulator [Coleofasciculaceae cyanobacterium]
MNFRMLEILLVEDDAGDIDLTEEALEESKLQINLNVVRDGVEAIAYLRREGEYANAISPDLILLDLNLPRKDGREVLQEIKTDDNLKYIPVVVLTTSDTDEDILGAYSLGANCYVNKPLGMEEFTQIVQAIEDFWFTIVKLPGRNSR